MDCRLIVDAPAAGDWNMAVDELLLDDAAATGRPTLRLYQWSQPTLSLGYFQNYADRASHTPSQSCSVVRRSTGGGAILHDHELTYSLIWPLGRQDRPLASKPARSTEWLYRAVHRSLETVLNQYLHTNLNTEESDPETPALTCALCCPDSAAKPVAEPFLCFLRRSPGDLLLGTTKIAGSAQRRRRGAVLQHGSILWNRSPCAPELLGIADLTDGVPSREAMLDDWLAHLADALDVRFEKAPLTDHEVKQARGLAQAKYGSQSWTHRR